VALHAQAVAVKKLNAPAAATTSPPNAGKLERPPCLGGAVIREVEGETLQAAVRLCSHLNGAILPMQGPPGAIRPVQRGPPGGTDQPRILAWRVSANGEPATLSKLTTMIGRMALDRQWGDVARDTLHLRCRWTAQSMIWFR
jgi:hypothetical protein